MLYKCPALPLFDADWNSYSKGKIQSPLNGAAIKLLTLLQWGCTLFLYSTNDIIVSHDCRPTKEYCPIPVGFIGPSRPDMCLPTSYTCYHWPRSIPRHPLLLIFISPIYSLPNENIAFIPGRVDTIVSHYSRLSQPSIYQTRSTIYPANLAQYPRVINGPMGGAKWFTKTIVRHQYSADLTMGRYVQHWLIVDPMLMYYQQRLLSPAQRGDYLEPSHQWESPAYIHKWNIYGSWISGSSDRAWEYTSTLQPAKENKRYIFVAYMYMF